MQKRKEMKQTAVEWLFAKIPLEWSSSRSAYEAFKQAQELEREQIEQAVSYGAHELSTGLVTPPKEEVDELAKEYYDEIYTK